MEGTYYREHEGPCLIDVDKGQSLSLVPTKDVNVPSHSIVRF